jgi:NAD(P)H-dependent FMN reductase
MSILLVLWHSQTGGTRAMVDAFAEGATDHEGVEIVCLHAAAAHADDLLAAHGVVFATPENLAAISGMLKDYFDRSYYDLLDRVNGKPFASMVCAGSDGSNAIRQLERIATGLRLRAIADPLLVKLGAQTPQEIRAAKSVPAHELARCRELGATFAAGLSLGIY